jgi:hypothetical protein
MTEQNKKPDTIQTLNSYKITGNPKMQNGRKVPLWRRPVFWAFYIILLVILSLAVPLGWAYYNTPSNIAFPKTDHYHFRMWISIDGKAENFDSSKYQHPYEPGICKGDLVAEPFHFHDNRDQLMHIHWSNMTGGQLLKFYGWNFIGGIDNNMGVRYDKLLSFPPSFASLPIHGGLPERPKDTSYWIYTGDKKEDGTITYEKKNFDDFVKKDLEDFFGKKSTLRQQREESEQFQRRTSFFNSVNTLAAEGHGSSHGTINPDNKTKEELEKVNNLLGNVAIFVQKNEPTAEQIKAKFGNPVTLDASSCGG